MAQEFLPTLKAAARHGGVSRRIKTKELARYIVTVVEGAIMQGRTLGDAALLRRQFACLKEYLKNRPTTVKPRGSPLSNNRQSSWFLRRGDLNQLRATRSRKEREPCRD